MAWPGFELAPSESPIMEITLTSATQPLNSRLFYSKVRFISPFCIFHKCNFRERKVKQYVIQGDPFNKCLICPEICLP